MKRADCGSILVIDADPNSTLPEALGAAAPQTIVGMVEDVSKHMDAIPAGMTKDRFIEMRVQESLTEEKGFDLLAMGRPEGPGCYCYVNNLLRDIISRLTENYDFIVTDNAAGMEHISRRTMRSIDKLVLVSDYSIAGIRSTKNIYALAKELGIKIGSEFLIVNKIVGAIKNIQEEIDKTGLKFIGGIPYDEGLAKWSVSGKAIFDFEDKVLKSKVKEIFDNLMRKDHADRTCKGKI